MSDDIALKVSKIGEVLNDDNVPLKDRFRALFTLRNVGGQEAISWIGKCFADPSALLKHELAYCLGQMQDEQALPLLESVLRNVNQEPMVRHEAGEAIGAIGSPASLPLLEEYASDPIQEVSETCFLAIRRIKSLQDDKTTDCRSPYNSVDPTPTELESDVEELTKTLLDDNADLFSRYKAMFALRNMNTPKSILGLCEGLFKGSALFRHEVAFVLGQLQSEVSVDSLEKALSDTMQNEMVRHEAAEALGAIATERCLQILKTYLQDKSRVVSESCLIALDMADYEKSDDFQYANTGTCV